MAELRRLNYEVVLATGEGLVDVNGTAGQGRITAFWNTVAPTCDRA